MFALDASLECGTGYRFGTKSPTSWRTPKSRSVDSE